MSIGLCLTYSTVGDDDLADALETLYRRNVRLYSRGETRSPWHVLWQPDGFGTSVALYDVSIVLRRGVASCGPLACAYAAWLHVQGQAATLELLDNGPRSWHVRARVGERIFDPQVIGARRERQA